MNNENDVLGFVPVHERQQVAKILGLTSVEKAPLDEVGSLIQAFRSQTIDVKEFALKISEVDIDALPVDQQCDIVQIIQQQEKAQRTLADRAMLRMPAHPAQVLQPPFTRGAVDAKSVAPQSLESNAPYLESKDIVKDIMQCMEDVLKVKRETLALDKASWTTAWTRYQQYKLPPHWRKSLGVKSRRIG